MARMKGQAAISRRVAPKMVMAKTLELTRRWPGTMTDNRPDPGGRVE
jgi:hypothetical protein